MQNYLVYPDPRISLSTPAPLTPPPQYPDNWLQGTRAIVPRVVDSQCLLLCFGDRERGKEREEDLEGKLSDNVHHFANWKKTLKKNLKPNAEHQLKSTQQLKAKDIIMGLNGAPSSGT